MANVEERRNWMKFMNPPSAGKVNPPKAGERLVTWDDPGEWGGVQQG
jgi:hypothetical protein